jgi:MFS family permease
MGSLAPLRHRPFALFWTGAFVSNIGTWMETVAVGILVTRATDQAGWAGLVAAAGFAPGAVLGPVGGALADRYPRKRVLIGTSAAQLLFAGTLCLLAARGDAAPGAVALVVLGAGCANALGFPSYQSMLPDLVPESEVVSAVGLSSAQWNLGRVIGPALAGLVIAAGGDRWGYTWAFAINTVSFLAVIVVVAVLPLPGPRGGPVLPIRTAIREGFRFSWREPGLRAVMTYMAMNSFLAAPFIALVAPMALQVLDAGKGGVSALVTAQGIGAVVVAVSLGSLAERYTPRRVLDAALWLLPVTLVVYALSPGIAFATLAIFAVGGCYLGALSSFTSIAQLRAPAEIRGRVLSVLNVLLGTLYPLGSVMQGSLADHVGQRATTAGAAVLLFALVALMRVAQPRQLRALDAPVLTRA